MLKILNSTILSATILYMCMTVFTEEVEAKDLGKRAGGFEITEQGFIEMMQEKLQKVDMTKEHEKMIKKARKRIYSPEPVKGIIRAKSNRVFYYDPTYVLKEDAVLPCGKVLYRAGTRVNPLDEMMLERRMFFIDARDKDQLEWLANQLNDIEEEIMKGEVIEHNLILDRVILVGGSPIEISKNLGREVYYDQEGGILVKKFGIEAVPAIIEQEGDKLKIQEVKL